MEKNGRGVCKKNMEESEYVGGEGECITRKSWMVHVRDPKIRVDMG